MIVKKFKEKKLTNSLPSDEGFKHNFLLQGLMNIEKRETKKNESFLYVTITQKETNKQYYKTVFAENKLYDFLEPYAGFDKIPVNADVRVVKPEVKTIDILNIYIKVSSPKEVSTQKKQRAKYLVDTLVSFKEKAERFEDENLKQLCLQILKNKDFCKLFLRAPATEKSSGAKEGGLIDITDKILRLTETTVDYFNNNETSDFRLNKELLTASAILCKIGKAYALSINNNTITRTLYGEIQPEQTTTRDMLVSQIAKLPGTKEGQNPAETQTFTELLHIISSCNYRFNNKCCTPKSKNAIIFADIISMAVTQAQFELLENDPTQDSFCNMYESGKKYWIQPA